MSENGVYVCHSKWSIWFYAPNKGAPVFFATVYCLSGLYHIFQCIHFKSWKLTGVFVFAAILFTGGYIAREMGAFDYTNVDKYIVATVLVYAAPPIFELANYNILGRILYYVPHYAPIHPGRVITTFATISAVVEALNGNGAARSANVNAPQNYQDVGHNLLKAALVIQIVVIFLFVTLAVTFHRRCIRARTKNPKLSSVLWTLYTSSALLAIRTIFRNVEYFTLVQLHLTSDTNPSSLSLLIRYEWFFYVFEASFMLANQVLWNVRHPRHYLPISTKIHLAPDNVTEIEGPGYKDARNFILTIFDPFDIIGLVGGRDKTTRSWDNDTSGGAVRKENPSSPA